MIKLLKALGKTIRGVIWLTPMDIMDESEPVRGHLCQRKEWKEGSSITCEVCNGGSMDFMFPSREKFDLAQELKEKQIDKKAS